MSAGYNRAFRFATKEFPRALTGVTLVIALLLGNVAYAQAPGSQSSKPASSEDEAAHSRADHSKTSPIDTVFIFERSLDLSETGSAARAVDARLLSIRHTGSLVGGFEVGDRPLGESLELYGSDYRSMAKADTDPPVVALRFDGPVATNSLGDVAEFVASRALIHDGTVIAITKSQSGERRLRVVKGRGAVEPVQPIPSPIPTASEETETPQPNETDASPESSPSDGDVPSPSPSDDGQSADEQPDPEPSESDLAGGALGAPAEEVEWPPTNDASPSPEPQEATPKPDASESAPDPEQTPEVQTSPTPKPKRGLRTLKMKGTRSDQTGGEGEGAPAWSPDSGLMDVGVLPSGRRKIFQMMRWANQSDFDAFAADLISPKGYNYEHDFKLIDCPEVWWASHEGVTWGTTFPETAGPYLDDAYWGEYDCEFDITTGLYDPMELKAATDYATLIHTDAGPNTSNVFELRAEKLTNDCGLVNDPDCIGLNTGETGRFKLIPRHETCLIPGSYRWDSSSKTCEYYRVPAYQDQLSSDGPTGHWRLGEPNGVSTAVDASGHEFDGSYVFGPAMGKQGALRNDTNTAVSFSSDDYVEIDYRSAMSTSSLTVEAWVRTSKGDSTYRPAVHRSGAFTLGTQNGRARATVARAPVVPDGSGASPLELSGVMPVNDGAWHHVAVTYDLDTHTAKLFVDGKLDATPYVSHPGWGVPPATDSDITIGRSTAAYTFMGDIDEVSVYDHALTVADFEDRFSHRWMKAPVCEGESPYTHTVCQDLPTSYWRLGDPSLSVPASDYTTIQHGEYSTGVALGQPHAVKEDDDSSIAITDGYVNVPYEEYGTFAQTKSITVEAWLRTSVNDTTYRLAVHRPGAFVLGLRNGRARATIAREPHVPDGSGGSPLELTGGTPINDGAWHLVAITYDFDTSMAKLFVDGKKEVEMLSNQGWRVPRAIGNGMTFGSSSSANTFVGQMDEVAIYDHALSKEDFEDRFALRWAPTRSCNGTTDYTDLICASNPMGYWRFEESDRTQAAVDKTGLNAGSYGADVVMERSGALTTEATKAIGTAETDSADVTIPWEPFGSYAEMDELTAEAWIHTSRNDGNYRLVVHRAGAFDLGIRNGKARATFAREALDGSCCYGGVQLNGSSTISNGSWHHLAATYDFASETTKLYVDGELEAAEWFWSGIRIPRAIGNGFVVGGTTTANGFVGDIDEVAVFDHGLTQAKIKDRWDLR